MQRGLETLEFRTTGVLLVLLDLPASDPADSECSCAGLTGSFCWAPFWSFAVLDALRSYQILSILSILSTSKIDFKKIHLHHLPGGFFFSFQQRLATKHALQHLKILSQPCTPPASESEAGAAGVLRSPPRRLPRSAWETQQLGCFNGFFNSSAPNKRCHYPLVNVNQKLWKTTMLFMGKSTISMAILT